MAVFDQAGTTRSTIQPIRRRTQIRWRKYRGFTLEEQEQTNWCWASVSQGYVNHLGGRIPPVTQRAMAAEILSKPECEFYPEAFNERVRIFDYWRGNGLDRIFDRPYTLNGLKDFIDGQAIVLCQIGWQSGGYHVVLIVGWHMDGANTILHVCDPAVGGTGERIRYEELCLSYQRAETGTWVFSGRLR